MVEAADAVDAAAVEAGAAGGRGAAAAEAAGTPAQEYLKKEQRELLEFVKERAELREEEAAKRKGEPQGRKPFNLTANETAGALQLSPDGKYVIASLFEAATGSKNNAVPNYITDSGFTEDIPGRSNVGDTQSRTRLVSINVETGEVKNVDHGQKKGDAVREIQLSQPVWSEDGTKAAMTGRATDHQGRLGLRARSGNRPDAGVVSRSRRCLGRRSRRRARWAG